MESRMKQDFTELSVQVCQSDGDVQKGEATEVEEEEELIYKPPRLFRKSLIFKTWKLFGGKVEHQTKYKRPLREHFFWLTVMFVGFLMAFSITDNAWRKFQTNPTFTSVRLNQNSALKAYPTVTVCPQPVDDKDRIFRLIEKSGIRENERQEIRELLETLPNFSYGDKDLRSVLLTESAIAEIKKLPVDDLRALVFDLALSCAEIFNSCRFKNKSIECCDKFKPIYTEKGFCYSFNSRVYGTPLEEVVNREVLVVEEFDDLSLFLELKVEAKIYLNSKEETIHFEQLPLVQTELETSVDITVSMQQTRNDERVKSLSINQRKCFFNDEVQLKHFSDESYTYSACLRDCKIDLTLEICGCFPPFHAPRHNLTICGIQDLKCLKDVRITDLSKCKRCELSCDFTTFTTENIFTDYLPEGISNLTEIDIALKHWPLLTFHREVRFGFLDFLVAFGSIMTLFLSFSLLSAIEVLLYTLRFIAKKTLPKTILE